ncbi:MAG: mechanosensitive ion channel family protein [Pseudohongiellaceae bacterium]
MILSAQYLEERGLQLLAFAPSLLGAVIVLFLFYLLGRVLSRAYGAVRERVSKQRIHDKFVRTLIHLVCLYIGTILALSIVGFEKLALSVLAGGGVTAIVLGFAFREVGENLIAGVFLAFSRPFNVGDLINSEGIEGRVRAIELRYTHLRSDDGKDIYVPSSQLLSKPLINYTQDGLRRFSITVGIDYANDAKKACKLLLDTVQQVVGVLEDPAASTTISSLEPQYVQLTVHYWQNLFDGEVDGWLLRINVMDGCRKTLLENDFTVSADTTSKVAVSGDLKHS